MDSYADRIGKFSDMISTTNDHIKAIQDMRINPRDLVGTGLNIAGTTLGGVGGIAGAVSGMQHFKDFKTMYGGLKNTLEKSVNSGGNKPSSDSLGSQASDQVQSGQTGEIQPEDLDEIASRINNLHDIPVPTFEANEINKAINSKINSSLDPFQKADLNNAVRASGRSNDIQNADAMTEGIDKINAHKSYLNFKNNAANDAINKVNSGQDIPESYDASGKPNDVAPTEQPQAQSNVNNVAQGNESDLVENATDSVENAVGDHVNAAADLEGQTGSLIARGRAALSNLTGGQSVPGRMGEAVDGLRVNPAFDPNDLGSQINTGARIQQNAADQAAHELAPSQAMNTTDDATGSGVEAVSQQLASTGATTSDIGTGVSEGLDAVSGITDGLDATAAFAGPAAPIIGLVSGLLTLGTTIASAIHKKPKAQAPPPPTQVSVGGNLRDTFSAMSGGIV